MIVQLLQSGLSGKEMVLHLLCMLFAITISFSFHEFMHARVAVWLGDDTPAHMGRVTLNPVAHLDPMGTLLILVAGFGWGKPVLYNPNNLKKFKSARLMNTMVHLAGVTGNFIVALIASLIGGIIYGLCMKYDHVVLTTLYLVTLYTVSFSLMLLAFNLLPIPPLDGFHVLEELLPYKVRSSAGYMKFQRYAPMALWVLFLLGTFSRLPILSMIIEVVEFPFSLVCGLVETLSYQLISLLV
ncbi:Zn-dependent protease (includes SpoIVFB) [Ruminococcaceae bacterium YRB3002]|nr:Zn-dependent protease (includes SpoIVFB) [Ruminococcaceae bacterium YRB3002]